MPPTAYATGCSTRSTLQVPLLAIRSPTVTLQSSSVLRELEIQIHCRWRSALQISLESSAELRELEFQVHSRLAVGATTVLKSLSSLNENCGILEFRYTVGCDPRANRVQIRLQPYQELQELEIQITLSLAIRAPRVSNLAKCCGSLKFRYTRALTSG